ncbi:Metallo-beta-lactamase [Trypanosoma melophagium]|uniref:Metallo-beta-lactamase n=1 Tax=Trypanosoma melophagium TaxID=715481 RepID=UPI00351A7B8A|nr:Metallo-beta-lactamase [Trypanosoma melophagium]
MQQMKEDKNSDLLTNTFSITIVGSGVSTGIPVIGHFSGKCACAAALNDMNGPNRRNNVSLLITVPSREASDKAVKHVLIDCGKTFRDAYFRVLAKHKVQYLDALLITHDHADAIAGLDDLRDLQFMTVDENDDWLVKQYISTYTSMRTVDVLRKQVGYIYRNSRMVGSAPASKEAHETLMQHFNEEYKLNGLSNNIGKCRSTALDFFTLPDTTPTPFYVPALGSEFPMYAVPVEHGAGYMSLGFVFGPGVAFHSTGATTFNVKDKSCVVYLSDVSFIPAAAMAFLQDLVKIDVLIVDLLYGSGQRHPTHYCMDDVMRLVESLQPIRTYGIGMYCNIEHTKGNEELHERLEELRRNGKCSDRVISVMLGFDNLEIPLPL